MPRTHGAYLRTVLLACIGCILSIPMLFVVHPRMKTIWGIGPDGFEKRARSLGRVLTLSDESIMRHRIIGSSPNPIWLTTLTAGREETRIAQSPSGELMGAYSAIFPLSAYIDSTNKEAKMQSLVERFLVETEGWHLVENRIDQVVDDSSRTLSFEFNEDTGNTGIKISSSSLSRIPTSAFSLLPWVFTSLMSLVLISMAVPVIWRKVKDLKAHPGTSQIYACLTGCCSGAASIFWLLPRFPPVMCAVIAIPFGIISSLLVLMGIFVKGNNLIVLSTDDPHNNPYFRSWLFGLSFLFLSSALLMLPGAASGSLDRFASSPWPWLTAFLFTVTIGMVSEWGIRPITDHIVPDSGGWIGFIAPAIILAVWVPYSFTGYWILDRFGIFLIGIGAGLTARHVGIGPNWVVPFICMLGLSLFPGFFAGIGHSIPSALFFITGCIIIPLFIGKRYLKEPPSNTDSAPEYIREIEQSFQRKFAIDFIQNLQSGLFRVDLPEKSDLQLGVAIRRAGKPTSAVCRVFGLGKKRMGIFLAEVPGESMKAAVNAIDIMATVEAVATLKQNPSAVMSEMYRLLRTTHGTESGEYRFNYSIIDERSNSVSIITAGHAPVIIYRPLVKKFEQFGSPQPGVFGDAEGSKKRDFETVSAQLISKDLVIFHSTGLLDESKPLQNIGREHIYDIVSSNLSDSCSELADKMQTTLDQFYSDKNQQYDIITLFIRNG